jgi:hypothetical protein
MFLKTVNDDYIVLRVIRGSHGYHGYMYFLFLIIKGEI